MNDRDQEKLTDEEIKKFQGLLERVGRRENKGFIFLVEEAEGAKIDHEGNIDAEGLVFSHNMSLKNMIITLICQGARSKQRELILTLEIIEFLKEKHGLK